MEPQIELKEGDEFLMDIGEMRPVEMRITDIYERKVPGFFREKVVKIICARGETVWNDHKIKYQESAFHRAIIKHLPKEEYCTCKVHKREYDMEKKWAWICLTKP